MNRPEFTDRELCMLYGLVTIQHDIAKENELEQPEAVVSIYQKLHSWFDEVTGKELEWLGATSVTEIVKVEE